MLVHRTNKLLVRSTSVGSDISCFHMQTVLTLIRQLLQALKGICLYEDHTSKSLFSSVKMFCIITDYPSPYELIEHPPIEHPPMFAWKATVK